MGVGRTREQARIDQAERERANEEIRQRERARRAAVRRPFSWQQPASPASREGHRYQACKDEFCDRFPCRVYKDGYRNGREDGYADGYDQGFPDGIMACPRNHQG